MVVNVRDNDAEQPGCLLDGVTQVPGLEDQGVALPLLPVQRHAGGDQTWVQSVFITTITITHNRLQT